MLLQRLHEYAKTLDLPPIMCRRAPIRYVIRIGPENASLIDTATSEHKSGELRIVPHCNRTSGARPILLADHAEYTLGMSRPGKRHAERRHALYKALIVACAEATRESSVLAVQRFLESFKVGDLALPEDFDPTASITFEVEGVCPAQLDSIQRWWARQMSNADRSCLMECLICGERRHPLITLPIQIHGIPGGQSTGMALISANNEAFESYGLERSHVAPICESCGHAVCTALNTLLHQPETHMQIGDSVYIFWSDQTDVSPLSEIMGEEGDEIQELLLSPRRGQLALSSRHFFMAEIKANSARVVIADWIDSTLGHIEQSIRRYFRLQEIAGQSGERWHFPIWRLAESDRSRAALLRFAIKGGKLPRSLLFEAVQKSGPEMTTSVAAFLKMALLSQEAYGDSMNETLVELDLGNKDPAYLCGRLYAILESIERRAMGRISGGIKNYYAAATARPAGTFGVLLQRGKIHLDKLQKKQEARGAYYGLSNQLQEILALLQTFPAHLPMEKRALFGIGYFNQQMANRLAALEAIASSANKADESDEQPGVMSDELPTGKYRFTEEEIEQFLIGYEAYGNIDKVLDAMHKSRHYRNHAREIVADKNQPGGRQ